MRSQPNYEVIKEPRGFIKCLEIFLAIFAFACATGFRGTLTINQESGAMSHGAEGNFQYPFDEGIPLKLSKNLSISTATESVVAPLNERSKAEFFVVIGVFCFLYSLGMLVYYVLFEEDSTKNASPSGSLTSPPVIDFAFGAFWTLFWFFSACAFAAAVSNISDASDTGKLINGDLASYCGNVKINCSGKSAKTATLTVAILLGFLNVFVWAGNIWFLWKETPWHKGNAQPATIPPPQQPSQPAAI